MADRLSVDPDGLGSFADRMDQARFAFDTSSAYVVSMGPEAGLPEVCTALADFDHGWTRARRIIDSYFTGISTVARNVSAAIKATDQNLAGDLPVRSGAHLRADF